MLNTVILILVSLIALSLVRYFLWQYRELTRRKYGRTPRRFSLFGQGKKINNVSPMSPGAPSAKRMFVGTQSPRRGDSPFHPK